MAACWRKPEVSSKDLSGTWELTTAGGQSLAALNIQSWQMSLENDGTWNYTGRLMGPLTGTLTGPGGTWKIEGHTIHFTVGARPVDSNVVLADGVLSLAPDPIVMPDGKTPVSSTWSRSR
jgi:hypothetical protein